ncbi:MAG: ATP-binding protein [Myxococcales bacterium]|nr:ATP-binding protein [Myxococcales bacterium]
MSSTASLKPWREVISPHEDVLEGSFQEAAFAADLTKVVIGIAPPEYQDPARFFERTVITEGMSLLLQSVVKRLAGEGGDPVIQLQTAFGGGKTHTMMAVLHVASGKVAAADLPGVPELLAKAKVKELVRAHVAVLDGNALSPSQPRTHASATSTGGRGGKAVTTNTLWGELAFQLGGADGYALVALADRDGTSPGKDVLATLFETHGPAVVLMDEAVAYLRQFESGKSYAGGTYNSNLSFLQALTEAASRVPTAMVLASLPESRMEVGDALGVQALDAIQKVFGRIEAVWKPVGADEACEIVRRRLFGPVTDTRARDAACRAFATMYTEDADKFPPEAREAAYLRRLEASYPVHPEVFERLYQDWSSLPKFQRTRGVLRLMARLVHSLWRENNRDLLILPGSIPLDDLSVRNELIKYLPAGWEPIVDKDIDGANASPRTLDDTTPALGGMQACRRAARTIFLGSAHSVGGQSVRGIGIERVRLGSAQPGQAVGKYDDALRRLGDRLHYLYAGNDRYWFDLRPNLRREMEERMSRYENGLHVTPEIEARLQKLVKVPLCSAVHVFRDKKDIPDKTDLRLVVLPPEHPHKYRDFASAAVRAASEILTKHGDKPREFQNRLLFLAADVGALGTLRDQVRRVLAWQSIVDDAEELNLDKHHEKEAKKSLDEAQKRVEGSLRETYRMLLVPMQDADGGEGVGTVVWEDDALALQGSTYEKAIELVTREREWVVKGWAPAHLATLLERWFWKADRPSVSAQKVWLDTCRFLYMPRLLTADVFLETVREGAAFRDFFGYAGRARASEDEADERGVAYDGLLFGARGTVHLDEASVLLRPDAVPAPKVAKPTRVADGLTPVPEGDELPPPSGRIGPARPARSLTPAPHAIARRFHGTVTLDPNDPISGFAQLVEEVLQHFSGQYGTKVTLSVDLEATRKEGFDLKTMRIVKENAKALKFKTADFEDE